MRLVVCTMKIFQGIVDMPSNRFEIFCVLLY